MICPGCKKEIPDMAKVCPLCGYQITTEQHFEAMQKQSKANIHPKQKAKSSPEQAANQSGLQIHMPQQNQQPEQPAQKPRLMSDLGKKQAPQTNNENKQQLRTTGGKNQQLQTTIKEKPAEAPQKPKLKTFQPEKKETPPEPAASQTNLKVHLPSKKEAPAQTPTLKTTNFTNTQQKQPTLKLPGNNAQQPVVDDFEQTDDIIGRAALNESKKHRKQTSAASSRSGQNAHKTIKPPEEIPVTTPPQAPPPPPKYVEVPVEVPVPVQEEPKELPKKSHKKLILAWTAAVLVVLLVLCGIGIRTGKIVQTLLRSGSYRAASRVINAGSFLADNEKLAEQILPPYLDGPVQRYINEEEITEKGKTTTYDYEAAYNDLKHFKIIKESHCKPKVDEALSKLTQYYDSRSAAAAGDKKFADGLYSEAVEDYLLVFSEDTRTINRVLEQHDKKLNEKMEAHEFLGVSGAFALASAYDRLCEEWLGDTDFSHMQIAQTYFMDGAEGQAWMAEEITSGSVNDARGLLSDISNEISSGQLTEKGFDQDKWLQFVAATLSEWSKRRAEEAEPGEAFLKLHDDQEGTLDDDAIPPGSLNILELLQEQIAEAYEMSGIDIDVLRATITEQQRKKYLQYLNQIRSDSNAHELVKNDLLQSVADQMAAELPAQIAEIGDYVETPEAPVPKELSDQWANTVITRLKDRGYEKDVAYLEDPVAVATYNFRNAYEALENYGALESQKSVSELITNNKINQVGIGIYYDTNTNAYYWFVIAVNKT